MNVPPGEGGTIAGYDWQSRAAAVSMTCVFNVNNCRNYLPSEHAWRGPAPPNATKLYSRGSCPCCADEKSTGRQSLSHTRSTETLFKAPYIFSLASFKMPSAA